MTEVKTERPKPQTPREARKQRVDWTGIVSTHKRPNLNRPGVN